ncbi:hypothetical protein MHC_04395 [Mycoplasma haemocanis str. Illinois]|uniref:Uncharacterized protein n=1 Tax=Mycoplasma haemocanis (strain Illinois) TaxID=1111676 RepID=H6N7W3_MYCHN|nr:hypothetical protein [Mycoplasma haemocanis]AEW45735.2 hypothetical protein MHC_04395 [Mycoplasma haemocanis str. Illinois]
MDMKLLGLMGGLGAVGAGGAAYVAIVNPFKEKENLTSELIKKEALVKPLTRNTGDDSKWNEAWKRYKEAHKVSSPENTYKEKDIWGLSEWSKQKGQDNAFEGFKNECESRAKLRINRESQEYKDFKNYCARPKTVSELIGEESGTTLLSKSGSGEEAQWNEAWKKYKASNTNATSANTDTWKIQDWASAKSGEVATSHYKDACEKQSNMDIDLTKGLLDTNFINVKNWCTKAS